MRLEDKAKEIIANRFGKKDISEVEPEHEFVRDYKSDSLDAVELIMELEDAFKISIHEEHAATLTTVGKVIDHLRENYEGTEYKP